MGHIYISSHQFVAVLLCWATDWWVWNCLATYVECCLGVCRWPATCVIGWWFKHPGAGPHVVIKTSQWTICLV